MLKYSFSLSFFFLFFFITSCSNNPPARLFKGTPVLLNDPRYFAAEYGAQLTDAGLYGIQTSDSGYIFTGLSTTYPIGQQGCVVVKTDKYGNTEWGASYGNDITQAGYSILETANHDYVVCGYSSHLSELDHDILFFRISNSGQLIWSKVIAGSDYEYGTDILELPDGSLILEGYSYSYGAGKDDVFLAKFTADGDSLWTRTYGGRFNEHGYSIEHTSDNGFIMTGFSKSFNNDFYREKPLGPKINPDNCFYDTYVIKTDANGDTLWTRTVGKAGHDRGQCARETKDGGYIITGHTTSFENGSNILLIKMSQQGDLEWSKTYSGLYQDASYSVEVMDDGGFLIAGEMGYMIDSTQNRMGLLIRTNDQGDTLWTKAVSSGGRTTVLYSASETYNSGHIAFGQTVSSFGGKFGLMFLSLDAAGNCNFNLPASEILVQNVELDIHNTTTSVGSGMDYREHKLEQIDAPFTKDFLISRTESRLTWGRVLR